MIYKRIKSLGKETPQPTDILIKLSAFHNVSVDYILGISDNPKIQK